MAKNLLIQNPITVGLANRLAPMVGKTPTSTADWFLQQVLRDELRDRTAENTGYSFKKNTVSKQSPSVGD